MDCEKFEPLLLDELYDELDELTSAAVKRHVGGCARCAGVLNGMKATRGALSLPLVAAPAGLEDRILAAAKEAHKVVPFKRRLSSALSVAGSWAMRPQTAMAAVFLLMIGTSAFLIRSKNYGSRESAVSVTVQGDPAPIAQVAQSDSLDDKAAAAAHGPSSPPNVTHPPVAAAPAASAVALADDSNSPMVRLTGEGAKAKDKGSAEDPAALGALAGMKEEKAPRPAPTMAPSPANAAAPAGAPPTDADMFAQAPAKPAFAKRAGPAEAQAQDPGSLGAAAFRARNFAEAARQYDIAAQNGDQNAALWAAESTREGQGCAVAIGRFEQLSQKAAGSWIGSEASLRAARCQIAMGQLDPARDRLNKLAQVGSHQQAAQQALGELNQVAQRKASAGGASAGAAAAPKAVRAAPARASSPARAPNESADHQKKVDTSVSY